MSYLEDILLKIVECREKETPLDEIARKLEIEPESIERYEEAFKQTFSSLDEKEPVKVAASLQMSPVAFTRLYAYYSEFFPLTQREQDYMIRHNRYKKNVEKIRKLSAQGENAKEIAEYSGLSVSTVRSYALREGISIRKRVDYQKLINKANEILQNIEIPLTKREIAKQLNVNPAVISNLISKGFFMMYSIGHQREEYVKKSLQEGKKLLYIAEELDLSGSTLYNVLRKANLDAHQPALSNLEIRIMQNSLNREDKNTCAIVEGVLKGKTISALGKETGLTRECARQYIEGLGLYNTWRAKREEKREEQHVLRTAIVSLLQQRIAQQMNSQNISWAERKAYEYNLALQQVTSERTIPHKKLVKLFTLYEKAKAQGKKHSLEWLGKKVNYSSASHIGRIFSRSSIEPFFGKREFERVSEEKVFALREASELGYLNISDISYFSGLSVPTVSRYYLGLHKRREIKRFHHYKKFTFNTASKIYQARDLGFSAEETSFVCDTLPEIVAYAEEQRKKIEPKIVHAIKILYPRENVTKPYINFDNRKSKYK